MLREKTLALAAALSLGLPTGGVAQQVTASTVVATVGGTEITIGHMAATMQALPPDQQQLPLDVLFKGILQKLIQEEAILQTVASVSPLTELQVENHRRALIANAAVTDLANNVILAPDAVQAAYDERYLDAVPETEYNASHILVGTEEEANAAIRKIDDGASFADTAMELSTGPSGPNGGELGWFGPGRMVPQFEDAVRQLEVGEVSQPVQTPFGWHVIRLNDTRVPTAPPIDAVRAELEQELLYEALDNGVSDMIARVDIDRVDVSGIAPEIIADPSIFAAN